MSKDQIREQIEIEEALLEQAKDRATTEIARLVKLLVTAE